MIDVYNQEDVMWGKGTPQLLHETKSDKSQTNIFIPRLCKSSIPETC